MDGGHAGWTGRKPAPPSRPNSCYLGRSRKKARRRSPARTISMRLISSTTRHGATRPQTLALGPALSRRPSAQANSEPGTQTSLRSGKSLVPTIPPRIRTQLIQDIGTLAEHDDLQSRAIIILKAKNRLSADDARLVEQAFAARMALGALPEALTRDEPTSAATDPTPPQPPSASMAAVKPSLPRGRPRKVNAAAEQSAAPPLSKPTIDDNPPASTHLSSRRFSRQNPEKRTHDQRAASASR
jgi:hypothetical protein